MRTEQLEHVAAVARFGSFRRAADHLYISQPALSESVRVLERELGVSVFERGRHGARISGAGREVLPHVLSVLEALDRLREACDAQHQTARTVRIATVITATVPIVTPAIRAFREIHPTTQVEVFAAQQNEIRRMLLDGGCDLGLVNHLESDDPPPDLETTQLLLGRPVVCLHPASPLADRDAVRVSDLRTEPLITMRAGFLMHRYVHRLLKDDPPAASYSADGAEMGKLLVAQGLGLTVLPDYSVIGDPLETHGMIVWRPIEDDDTRVKLVVQRGRTGTPTRAAGDLHDILRELAALHSAA